MLDLVQTLESGYVFRTAEGKFVSVCRRCRRQFEMRIDMVIHYNIDCTPKQYGSSRTAQQ